MQLLKKLILLTLISLVLLGCQQEEEESGDPDPGQNGGDPIQTDPPDDGSGPVEGKDLILLGNHQNAPAYEEFGQWHTSDLPGFDESESRYSLDPQARAFYETQDVGTHRYCVSVYRVTHPDSTEKAQWTLIEGEESKERQVLDYRWPVERSGFVHLGEYEFSGREPIRLELEKHIEAVGGALRADEVRFKKLTEGFDCWGKTHAEVKKWAVIDNKKPVDGRGPKRDDPGYREQGEWRESQHLGHRNSISRYSHDEEASATYSFIPKFSNYCLSFYRVAQKDTVKSTRIEVIQQDAVLREFTLKTKLSEDQSGWADLDRVEMKNGIPVTVKVQREEGEEGVLRADALRIDDRPKACR